MYYIRLTAIDKANYVFRSYYTPKPQPTGSSWKSFYSNIIDGTSYKKFSTAYKKLKVAESRVFEGAIYRKNMKLKLEVVKLNDNGTLTHCKNELNKLKLEII